MIFCDCEKQNLMNGEGGNLVFSPFSLGLVLLMARFNARGKTHKQVHRAFNPIGNDPVMLEDLVSMRAGLLTVLNSIKVNKF